MPLLFVLNSLWLCSHDDTVIEKRHSGGLLQLKHIRTGRNGRARRNMLWNTTKCVFHCQRRAINIKNKWNSTSCQCVIIQLIATAQCVTRKVAHFFETRDLILMNLKRMPCNCGISKTDSAAINQVICLCGWISSPCCFSAWLPCMVHSLRQHHGTTRRKVG